MMQACPRVRATGVAMQPWLTMSSTARRRRRALCMLGLAAALLGGCAVELQNTQAREQLRREQGPHTSLYSGWRVYQDRCASCHGAGGNGSATAPDLLQSVRTMGPRRFVGVLLGRYDLLPPESEPAARDEWIEDVLQRRRGAFQMPAWQGEPAVTAHIADLYAWLSARAEGTLPAGRPR